jgi:hypothetical protein
MGAGMLFALRAAEIFFRRSPPPHHRMRSTEVALNAAYKPFSRVVAQGSLAAVATPNMRETPLAKR